MSRRVPLFKLSQRPWVVFGVLVSQTTWARFQNLDSGYAAFPVRNFSRTSSFHILDTTNPMPRPPGQDGSARAPAAGHVGACYCLYLPFLLAH